MVSVCRSLCAVVLLCSSIGLVLPRCEDNGFTVSPPEIVLIPEGGSTTLFCTNNNGLTRWYKGSSLITGETTCDCVSTSISINSANLTFTNFRPESAGTYGCWANRGGMFDECNFEVEVAVPPQIMLDQDDVRGNMLGRNLTITPTVVNFGRPVAEFVWSLSEGALEEGVSRVLNGNPRVTVEESTGALTVSNVQSSDRGVYTFRAINSAAPDGVQASVDVIINFLDNPGPTFREESDQFIVECIITGHPGPVTATLSPSSPVTDSNAARARFQSTRRVTHTFSQCVGGSHSCSAANEGGREKTVIREAICRDMSTPSPSDPTPTPSPNPLPAPTNVRVEQGRSLTEVIVSWTATPSLPEGGGYRVKYESGDNVRTVDFVGETSVIIEDLVAGEMYQISVTTLRRQGDADGMFSEAVQYTILCPDGTFSLTAMISGVRVVLDSKNGRRTLSVHWNDLNNPNVTMYRVTISSSMGTSQEFIPPTVPLVYSLPPEYCNGSTYVFGVAAQDRCGRPGPVTTVSRGCTSASANVVTFNVDQRGPTEIQLLIINVMKPDQSFNIAATTLRPKNGSLITNQYSTESLRSDSSVCIGRLLPETFYNICLSTADSVQVCIQESTTSVGTESLGECLVPLSTERHADPTRNSSDGFPDWAIAVIVVGVFALLALVFCVIGLCFACSTDNGKDYDGGSLSSLQTASIPPGPSPYVRNNPSSPQRSCLAYRHHSTDWNEHRDTLREMDTARGTHV